MPAQVAALITGFTQNKYAILLLINVFLVIVGCFMDTGAAITILTPMLLPFAEMTGLSRLALGIVMCVNLVIGQLTPPVGVSMFVGCKITNQTVKDIFPYLIQFIIALYVVSLLLTYFPQIQEFLPK